MKSQHLDRLNHLPHHITTALYITLRTRLSDGNENTNTCISR